MENNGWITAKEYVDITYRKKNGVARIAFNRPEVRNAFRPKTVSELFEAFIDAREDQTIGVVLLSAEGPSPKDGVYSFCSGGDQRVRDKTGYRGEDGIHRLNILEVQRQIRFMNKAVIAVVPGWAVGGGHSLHVVCDLTIASDNAIFGQTGPKVGSFDGGFGSSYLARHVGQKKAREIWFLCQQYSAQEALDMGMDNKVVPLDQLEDTVMEWCAIMQERSPLALRMIKRSLNAELDGQHGLMQLAGDATLMYYLMEEAQEGKKAFLEKRAPDFKKYPKFP